jgi:clan AA aspartic protease (TIGR02281 family)
LQEANLLAGIQALPTSGKLYLELAKLYMKLDLLDQATSLLEKVKTISPSLKESAESLLARVDDAVKRREAVIVPIAPGSRSIRTRAVLDGGKEFTFIIDTGATYTTIPSSLAQELGYTVGPPQYAIATAAGIISVPMIRIQSLSLGGYSVHNLDVLVLPTEIGPDVGLLGLNFLNNFKYGVDSARSEFRLERR